MDAPFVTVSQALKDSISSLNDTMGPPIETVKMENPPSTGFKTPEPAAEPPPEKPAAAEKAAAPAPDPKFESRMSKLTAQAQKVRQEQAALKAERDQMAADLAELQRFRELKGLAKEDPVAVAEAFGFKPDEYATTLIEKGAMSPERRKLLEQAKEINELKTWQKQQVEQAEAQRRQALISGTMKEFQDFASAAGDKYDLVKRTGAYGEVLKRVEKHYLETMAAGEPEEMPLDEAFALVEAELEQQYAPLLESPKLRTRGKSAATSQATSSGSASARKPSGTISSTMRGASTKPEKLSERERMEKAGEVFLNQIYGRR